MVIKGARPASVRCHAPSLTRAAPDYIGKGSRSQSENGVRRIGKSLMPLRNRLGGSSPIRTAHPVPLNFTLWPCEITNRRNEQTGSPGLAANGVDERLSPAG